jgi:hypothetical protein
VARRRFYKKGGVTFRDAIHFVSPPHPELEILRFSRVHRQENIILQRNIEMHNSILPQHKSEASAKLCFI